MAARDLSERSEIGRLGAAARWATTVDRKAATQAARDALMASFEPGPEVTDPRQRESMRQHALNEHMIRMRRARRRNSPASNDDAA